MLLIANTECHAGLWSVTEELQSETVSLSATKTLHPTRVHVLSTLGGYKVC